MLQGCKPVRAACIVFICIPVIRRCDDFDDLPIIYRLDPVIHQCNDFDDLPMICGAMIENTVRTARVAIGIAFFWVV